MKTNLAQINKTKGINENTKHQHTPNNTNRWNITSPIFFIKTQADR